MVDNNRSSNKFGEGNIFRVLCTKEKNLCKILKVFVVFLGGRLSLPPAIEFVHEYIFPHQSVTFFPPHPIFLSFFFSYRLKMYSDAHAMMVCHSP